MTKINHLSPPKTKNDYFIQKKSFQRQLKIIRNLVTQLIKIYLKNR